MPDRPNVIVILTDDQGPWALGCCGNHELQTPHIDRLASEGVRFENWCCVSPVCSAARASLITGRLPSQHGVHDWIRGGNSTQQPGPNGELIRYLDGQTTYVDCLAEAGYSCGLSGKWHLGDSHHPQHGFSYWFAHAHGGGMYIKWPRVDGMELVTETEYVTYRTTEQALAFLEQQDGSAPFYLSVHYTAPHSPWDRAQHPAELFDPYYDDCPFESVPDEPPHPQINNRTDFFTSPERRREKLAGYFAAISGVDRGVGEILAWLEAHGQRENTLILYTSDNGMNMGHHGICGKGNGTYPVNMFDTSVKVPAIISRPGCVPEGLVAQELYAHYDWFPTLLDYLDLPIPETEKLPGSSFAGFLQGTEEPEREPVMVFDEYGATRMIRTKTAKLVHRHPLGFHEYYDLVDDPGERKNVYCDFENHDQIVRLREQLTAWFDRYVKPRFDGNTLEVSGRGQADLADRPEAFPHYWPIPWKRDKPSGSAQ